MSTLDTGYRVRSESVSAERVGGDVIAVNLRTGTYFSLSGPAADVWTAATSGHADWVAILDDAYGSTVPRDEVQGLLQSCEEWGLLEAVAPGHATEGDLDGRGLPDDWDRGAWQVPVLEAFDDLSDLIMVDPIHDASALGWPRIESADDPDRA